MRVPFSFGKEKGTKKKATQNDLLLVVLKKFEVFEILKNFFQKVLKWGEGKAPQT